MEMLGKLFEHKRGFVVFLLLNALTAYCIYQWHVYEAMKVYHPKLTVTEYLLLGGNIQVDP
jgi:hypothetical protein